MTHRSTHYKLQKAITFDPTVGFSGSTLFQNQEAKIFPEVPRSTLFEGLWRAAASKFTPGAINSPTHAPDQREIFLIFCSLPTFFTRFFLSSKHQIQTKKEHPKTHQNFLILLSSPKTQGIILMPNLAFLGSTLCIWGLGVWM